MNIHEYQSKEILKAYGVNVPRGCMVKSARQAQKAYQKFACDCVLKAQVYTGIKNFGLPTYKIHGRG